MGTKDIAGNFAIYGKYINAELFGSGHINSTYIVSYSHAGKIVRYILRKINKFVFKQPEIVIANSVNISSHIKNKLIEQGIGDVIRRTMTFYKTHDNEYYYIDENNDYWSMVLFFENAYTINYVQTKEQSYKSAKAFGNFQKLIIDADINDYKETISDFHNLPKRMVAFDEAIATNPYNRLKYIGNELVIINLNRNISYKYTELINKNLPIRITHNDTKINNVMLDVETDEGLCVIDLDTIMPGTILNDFGDMVRTSTATVAEDEKDLSKVNIQLDIFDAMTQGYLEPLLGLVTKLELDNLVYGAKLIIYEQAIRFLTDYLLGDIYYSTAYNGHNFVRAKNQLALLRSVVLHEYEMKNIIKKHAQLS